MADTSAIIDRLRRVVGDRVIVDTDRMASYTTDWTRRFRGTTVAVVRPGTTAEVAGVVRACRELGVALVPQGGNTGLVGGGVPLHGEVVLTLQGMRSLSPVDGTAGQVTAEAGVTLAAVQQAARSAGWEYGVDLASRDSATVGGMVATNAGGTRVLRHGDTRAQVLGVEAVLGTGAVLSHLGGLIKDNTGYHLPGLFCGSEGTLAVVTAARLRLVPALPERTVAVLAFATVTDAVALLLPPVPVQDSVKLAVAVSAPVDLLPLVATAPLHAPEATHDVAFVELQLMVEEPPELTAVGDALNDTVGAGVGLEPPPPQAASAKDAPMVRPAVTNRVKHTCQCEACMGVSLAISPCVIAKATGAYSKIFATRSRQINNILLRGDVGGVDFPEILSVGRFAMRPGISEQGSEYLESRSQARAIARIDPLASDP